MNKEWLMILIVALSTANFAIGGTGFKWVRRFVMPFLNALFMALGGFVWWICLIFCALASTSFHLPYGERTNKFVKSLTFICYSLSTIIFGFTIWQIILPIVLFVMFLLSNYGKTAKEIPWKVWELTAGFLNGVTLAVLLSKH